MPESISQLPNLEKLILKENKNIHLPESFSKLKLQELNLKLCDLLQFILPAMVHIMNQPKLRDDDGPIVSLQFYTLIALVITLGISLTIVCLFSFLSVLLSFQLGNSANKCAKLRTCLVAVWACALFQSSVAPLAVANCKSFAEVNCTGLAQLPAQCLNITV